MLTIRKEQFTELRRHQYVRSMVGVLNAKYPLRARELGADAEREVALFVRAAEKAGLVEADDIVCIAELFYLIGTGFEISEQWHSMMRLATDPDEARRGLRQLYRDTVLMNDLSQG